MSSTEWDNPSYFPPYLQVLRAVDPPERAWSGLSSRPQLDHLEQGMAALDSRVHERLGQLEERLEGKVLAWLERLEAQLQGAQQEQGKLQGKLAGLEAQVQALQAKKAGPPDGAD